MRCIFLISVALLVAACNGSNESAQAGSTSGLAGFLEWVRANNGCVGKADGRMADPKTLTSLSEIKDVGLGGSKVTDIGPLAQLTELKSLSLAGAAVEDLSPLAKLTKLEYLVISHTRVTDLTPLMGLTNLKRVGVSNTPVTAEEVARLRQALPKCVVYGHRSDKE
jgi:Leucine-rich repeat (LRR) protein